MTSGLGEQPSRPLWALLDRRDEFDRPDLPLLTVISEHGVRVRDLSDGRTPSEDLSSYRVVAPGDLVVNKMWARFGAYGVAQQAGIISPAYWVLTPRVKFIEPRFLHHLLRSAPYRAEIWRRSKDLPPNGFDLSWDQFKTITAPEWSLSAQEAVADYLDRETARIDAAIASKERMVCLLSDRWQEIVSQRTYARTVADANPKLPSGWRMMPIRRCLDSAVYGIGESSSSEGAYAVLGMSNVNSGYIVGAPGGFVDNVSHDLLLAPGDLLFNRTNSRELVGKVGLVRTISLPTTFASYLVRLRAGPAATATYLNYLLNSREVLGLARSLALPSLGQANLNPSRYSSMRVPIPPTMDQHAIVRDLEEIEAATRQLTNRCETQVTLLRERRQALITAAVTGQIEVPVAG